MKWSGTSCLSVPPHIPTQKKSLKRLLFHKFRELVHPETPSWTPLVAHEGLQWKHLVLEPRSGGEKNGGKFRSIVYKPIRCLALNSPIFARTINWTHPQILEKETKPKTMPLVQSVFCTHHPAHKTLGWEPFFCLSWNWNLLATL